MKLVQTCIAISALMLFQATTAEHADSEASEGVVSPFRVETSPDGVAYFPKGKESYYTTYFRAADLPSMQFKREEKGRLRFRLTILPAFSKPLFLTYSRGNKGARIQIKRLNLRGTGNDTEPGEVELQARFLSVTERRVPWKKSSLNQASGIP